VNQLAVSYLGVPGSYTQQAAEAMFPGAPAVGYFRFDDVIESVQSGKVHRAVIAIENSTAGRVVEMYRLLPSKKVEGLYIVREHIDRVEHCLVANADWVRSLKPPKGGGEGADADAQLSRICKKAHTVLSHPQALQQCQAFIKAFLPHAKVVDASDTASAAKRVGEAGAHERILAISSKKAAEIYSGIVLRTGIEDDRNNATRFIVLSRTPNDASSLAPGQPCLTTILFQTKHQPGALVLALSVLAKGGLNLTKLETYMTSGDFARPTFYVDVAASSFSRSMTDAMEEFGRCVDSFRVLGTYPASPLRGVIPGFLPVQ
jgi:prephenate dehydratase